MFSLPTMPQSDFLSVLGIVITVVLSVLGIVITVLAWLYTPRALRHRIDLWRTGAHVDKILALDSQGLSIEHREPLASRHFRRKNKHIFWPVVPPDAPSIIHACFLRYLKDLSDNGLRVTLFLFDEYSAMVKGRPATSGRTGAMAFADHLRKMGLSECSHEIVFESQVTRATISAARILPRLLRYFASLSTDSLALAASQKTYLTVDTPAIRYIKPVLNMAFFLSVKRPFGYTISGDDERPLWEAFNRIALSEGLTPPVNLYIPLMPGLDGTPTNALDSIGNITSSDSTAQVAEKASRCLASLADGNAISYFLHYVYLAQGRVLRVAEDAQTFREYASLSAILDARRTNQLADTPLVDALVKAIMGVMRSTPGGVDT